MKLKRLKPVPADFLKGVAIETDVRDGSLHGITITDADGRFIKIAMESYSMYAYEKAPPETVKRWALKGKLLGDIDYYREFEDNYDARRHREKLAEDCGKDADDLGIECVEVEVEVAE